MSRDLLYRPKALVEIAQAAEWYEQRGDHLSAEFLDALDTIVAEVLRNPLQYPVIHPEQRRALLPRFPYSLIFSVLDRTVVILGCVHWRQNPRRWRTRR